jgi:hypothetical protein
MNKIIINIISTQRGWLIRQAIKYATLVGASLTTWLLSQGVAIGDGATITAAVVTLATGLAEMALSKAASHIAAKP